MSEEATTLYTNLNHQETEEILKTSPTQITVAESITNATPKPPAVLENDNLGQEVDYYAYLVSIKDGEI